jgi:hypothetical protein
MTPDKEARFYTQAIKKMLLDKHKGYKTVGTAAGGALGAGIGGTVGLVNTINKHRKGELDELDNKDKIKEYLKSVGSGAGIGLGAGALVGAGAGELGRRWSIREPVQHFREGLNEVAREAPENVVPAGEWMHWMMDRTTPQINLTDSVKTRIMDMLGKKKPTV